MTTTRQVYSSVSSDPNAAWALPSTAYLDAGVFQDEATHVLKAGWLPVGRVNDTSAPGDYRTVDVLNELLVVTRDLEGELHVLSRVCRHRAMPVVEGTGNTKSLTCPYHLWRFNMNGKLASAPGMKNSSVFDPANCSLPHIRHEIWNGWIFVNLSGDAQPLAPQLEPLSERLNAADPASMVSVATLEFESPWNWKVMVENFLESYHHIGPHAGSLQLSNPGLGTYASDLEGAFALLENPPKSDEDVHFVAGCIFPLTLFFFQEGDAPFGGWYELSGIKKDRFLLRIHILLPQELADDAEVVAMVTEAVREIHLEDIPVCEGVQRGLGTSSYQSGPLSHLEECNWKLHRYLQARFAEKE